MFKVIISSLLAVASLFIGFYPHSENCNIISMSNKYHCEGWWYHIVLGTFLYILAVLISQNKINNFTSFYTLFDTSNKLKEPQTL
jgi:hypothetical protein